MLFHFSLPKSMVLIELLITTTIVISFSPPQNGICITLQASRGRLQLPSQILTELNAKFKTFDEMLEYHSDVPLLIDFYAPWCGPCKLMKDELTKIRPVLDTMGPLISQSEATESDAEDCNVADAFQSSDCLDIKTDTGDKNPEVRVDGSDEAEQITTKPSGIPIFHVNANKFPQVGARNKIHGLPTLVLFLKGVEVWRNEGVMSGEEILKTIGEELGRIDESFNVSIGAVAQDLPWESNG